MATLDREKLIPLASNHHWPSISLYLPTHRAGADKEQDRIRMKNLLRSACERLTGEGMRETDANALCAPARAVLEDETFWRDSSEGLALFLSEGVTETLRTGTALPEIAVVGDRFYLRPLIAEDPASRAYFALALDRNGCRLFRGLNGSIEQVPLEGIPTSLADELRFDEVQESIQYSSVPSAGQAMGGGRPVGAVFHGHGGEKDTDKVNLERYFHKVDGAVSAITASERTTPVVLLGVDYAVAIYRGLSGSAAILPTHIPGATDEMTPRDIKTRALEALEPWYEASMAAEIAELTEKEGSPLVSHDPAQIVAAAASGRVKTLYFDDGIGPFGTFDRDKLEVRTVCQAVPRLLRENDLASVNGDCGWDLVDLAAAETTLHGGMVHAFTGEDAPIHGVAAVMRY